ncbi:hypothetical protein [Pseudomonas sp. SDI]|uniref:hypothetical protein n=1 Tax=Pseudomonas sp. SDI TaxID=2170734 RepID=UPI001058196E|nr:hypothetical protein [Pseudomonas sp. SDI]
MNAHEFYVIEHNPDGKCTPYFFGSECTPKLPSLHLPSEGPDPRKYANEYSLKAKTYNFSFDFNANELLASKDFIEICKMLSVKMLIRPVKISLYRNTTTQKLYFLFFPLARIELLNRDQSTYTEESQAASQKISEGNDEKAYEKIDRFITLPSKEHLFYCIEIKEIVCSSQLKEAYEKQRLTGIKFTAINEDFRYDPWGDFCS